MIKLVLPVFLLLFLPVEATAQWDELRPRPQSINPDYDVKRDAAPAVLAANSGAAVASHVLVHSQLVASP